MRLFEPVFSFARVWEITPEWAEEHHFSVLLLDVDNTLTTHDNPEVPDRVREWIEKMRGAGMRMLILSNNRRERVEPFARSLGLGCIARAAKPLGGGVRRAMAAYGAAAKEIAVVGDQIFTDVLCANLAGACPVLVEPMELERFRFFKVKRALERAALRGYDRSEDAQRARYRRFYGKHKG